MKYYELVSEDNIEKWELSWFLQTACPSEGVLKAPRGVHGYMSSSILLVVFFFFSALMTSF